MGRMKELWNDFCENFEPSEDDYQIPILEGEFFTFEQVRSFLYEVNEVPQSVFSKSWLDMFKYDLVKKSSEYALTSLKKDEYPKPGNRVLSKRKYAILMEYLEDK